MLVQHKGFTYLIAWLGLKEVAALEPKPGIEPTTGAIELNLGCDPLTERAQKIASYYGTSHGPSLTPLSEANSAGPVALLRKDCCQLTG